MDRDQWNSHPQVFDFTFIDLTTEDQVRHVGHTGDGRALIEGVGLNDLVAHFDRHIEHHAVDSAGDHGVGCFTCAAGSPFFHNAQVVFRSQLLFLGLEVGRFRLLEILLRYDSRSQQRLLALKVTPAVFQRNAAAFHPALGRGQCRHIGHHPHTGQDGSGRDRISSFHKQRIHDAADLRLDEDFFAGPNRARTHRLLDDVGDARCFHTISSLGCLFLFVQVIQSVASPSEDQQDKDEEERNAAFLHVSNSIILLSAGLPLA